MFPPHLTEHLLQRFVDFTNSTGVYTLQHSAIQLRNLFCRTFRTLSAEPRRRIKNIGLVGFEAAMYDVCTVEAENKDDKNKVKRSLELWKRSLKGAGSDLYLTCGLAVLATLSGLETSTHLDAVKSVYAAAEDLWAPDEYEAEFRKTPELVDLTSTPFMLQIISQILPSLGSKKQAVREIKSMLVMTIGDTAAEKAWSVLNEPEGILKNLPQFQAGLELDDPDIRLRRYAEVAGAACAITEHFEKKFVIKTEDDQEQQEPVTDTQRWKELQLPAEEDAFYKEDKEGTIVDLVDLKKLTSVLTRELLRALRRRPTRRAAIYDLFLDFYIERGKRQILPSKHRHSLF